MWIFTAFTMHYTLIDPVGFPVRPDPGPGIVSTWPERVNLNLTAPRVINSISC